MQLKPFAIVLGVLLGTLISFQNCAKTQFTSETNDELSLGVDGEAGGGGGAVVPIEDIRTNCDTRSLMKVSEQVNFPKPARCAWGLNGNLSEKNAFVRARSEQSFALSVPADAVICKLDFNFPTQDMLYDDQIIMTYNNYVIASSYKGLVQLLNNRDSDGLYKYDWSLLQGKSTNVSGTGEYIAGEELGSRVRMPATQSTGKIEMSITDEVFYKFAAKKEAAASHKFGFITTGDDDDETDCMHLPVEFSVDVHYYRP